MRRRVRFTAFFVVILMMGQSLQPAILCNIMAEPIPIAPRTLKEVVLSLNTVTPAANQTDEDGDGLWDPVEAVIGTDFNESDSDYDRLDDLWEVMNGSDPLNPDTNLDGFPDYFEVTNITLDLDEDGVRNLLDPDNDGDGVGDSLDLSPFARSDAYDTLHLDLRTNGNPTYVSFQIRPGDPEHLKLFAQAWDWPNDDEPPMRDLDGSDEDVKIVPILRLNASSLPDQADVIGYGITISEGVADIPLFPVWDKGTIVAFSGRMFYPSPTPSVSIDAELIWRVVGSTDVVARGLRAYNGLNLTVTESGQVFGNGSGVRLLETFLWNEVGDDEVALRALNGKYLSVKGDGLIEADASDLGADESFTVESVTGGITLNASNGLYVTVRPDGTVAAEASTVTASEIFGILDLGYLPESILLAFYGEDFSLASLVVEENYGSDVGLFFDEEVNHTIAANLALAYDFLRNSSNTLMDMPGILGGYGLDVYNLTGSYSHKDEAFMAFTNDLTPAALDSLPDNVSLPVVSCYEDKYINLELSELLSGTYIAGSSLSIDLTGEEVVTTKALQTNWYNTSDYVALDIDLIMEEIEELGMGENQTVNLQALTIAWNSGEQSVSNVGSTPTDYDFPEAYDIDYVVYEIIGEGLDTWETLSMSYDLFSDTMKAYKAVKFMKSLKQAGWSVSAKGSKSWFKLFKSSYRQISKVKSATKVSTASKAFSRMGKAIEIIGALVEIGFTAYTLYAIFDCADWDPMSLNTALLKTLMEFTYTVVLINIGFIPGIGWLISMVIGLSDLFGGWSNDLFAWLLSVMTKITSEVTPDVKVIGEPEIIIDDKDGNGLDVGDRITYKSQLQALVYGADWSNVWRSDLWPYYNISAPPGSNSETGYLYPPSNPNWPGYGLWRFPVPPRSQWTQLKNSSTPEKWNGQIYEAGAWIEPGIGMPNFPVNIHLESYYQLWYTWEHFVFLVFYGFWCEHQDRNEGVSTLGSFTLKFDVLPGTIEDFAEWRGITPLDHDGDLLFDRDEDPGCVWKWDTDSDGINDKYEREIGTDPRKFDTDLDSLMDGYEVTYGTNATDSDTDDDGLLDNIEVSGWLISFNYAGQEFVWHVTSDPMSGDSDGDGVGDEDEYWSGLNPMSVDTDGDGVLDEAVPQVETHVAYEGKYDITHHGLGPSDIAVDGDGFVYFTQYQGWGEEMKVYVLDSNLTLVNSWNITDASPNGLLAIDETNGYIHIVNNHNLGVEEEGDYSHNEDIKTYYLNGTPVDDETWATRIEPRYENGMLSLDVDENGNVYVARSGGWFTGLWIPDPFIIYIDAFVDVYAPNRTLLDTWGSYGSGFDEFTNIRDVAVDDVNGLIYFVDIGQNLTWYVPHPDRQDRLAKFETEGDYVGYLVGFANGTEAFEFSNPTGVDVDDEGFVYVVDSNNYRIHKFDHNGMPMASWGGLGSEGGYFEGTPERIAVDGDKNVYVTVPNFSEGETTSYVYKFSQWTESEILTEDVIPDRDGDGLTNEFETSSWDVTYTNATGTYTIHAHSDPYLNDTDFDGLTDYGEFINTTNPRDVDTDDDGLGDLVEIMLGTDPLHYDTDGDGLDDGTEVTYGSDPLTTDTEEDGLTDLEEFELGSNPSSNDTDGDGLDDLQELVHNSSLFDPDTDGDFMFDGQEAANGTDPTDPDSDGDDIPDGHEMYYGTDPLSNDTDGDNVTDSAEIAMRMNPLLNDTDGDGSLDGEEIKQGTNPNNDDTDGDGIPDSEDPDSASLKIFDIVVSHDPDNETSEFLDDLSQYANLTIVTPAELLSDHTNARNILLIGRPESNNIVGRFIEDLLSDCGDVLTDMIESDQNRMAVRYGVWNETQTVVLLSHPYPLDIYRSLEIMRSKTVTISPDSAELEFNSSLGVVYPSGNITVVHGELSYEFFMVDEIDTLKNTDARVYAVLEEPVNPTVMLVRCNETTTPLNLNESNGLKPYDLAMGRYLDLSVSQNVQNETGEIVEYAKILLYYRESDLDRDWDGELDGFGDFNETTLGLYYHNGTEGSWVKLSTELEWVYGTGVNTTDVEIYGESYAGHVWAYISHFSLYGIAGLTHNRPPNVTVAYPSVEVLWPPNGKYVNVTVEGVTDPDGDNTITGVTCDEPSASAEGAGGKKYAPDAMGVGTDTASLRAERSGEGNGRVYVVHFLAGDGRGEETTGSVTVYVPHDVRKGEFICVDDGQLYDATGLN